jgi:hypothetical protein
MVKKGQEQVSRMDSPRQGEPARRAEGHIQHRGGSKSQQRSCPQSEGSSSKG